MVNTVSLYTICSVLVDTHRRAVDIRYPQMVKIKNLQMVIEEVWSYGLRDKLLAIITMANRGCNYPPSIKEGEIANAVLAFIMDNIDVLIKKRNELQNKRYSRGASAGASVQRREKRWK